MATGSGPSSYSVPVPIPDIDPGSLPSRCPNCKSQRPGSERSRNLVVCIDGTCNEFGQENTNVVKLFAQIDLQSQNPEQFAYYSSGIGTDPNSRGFVKILDMTIGWDIRQTIKDVYRWLVEKYKEGDQIYLFGFSRGAYQVRVLAGMIHEVWPVGQMYFWGVIHSTGLKRIYQVGLIRTPTEKQIRAAYDYFQAIHSGKPKTRQIAREFKNTFSWKDLRVHFIGVWDTVSSAGLLKGDLFFPTFSSAAHACHIRHALALDERRAKFMPEYFHEMNSQTDNRKSKYIFPSNMEDTPNPLDPTQVTSDDDQTDSSFRKNRTVDMKEVWFAGCHADVGGKREPGRSHVSGNVSLLWMRQEATKHGLELQPTDLVWVPADLDFGTRDSMDKSVHWSRPRRIIPGQKIHASVLYANVYTPQATLGEGFDIPVIQTEDGELGDGLWEMGLFDETAAQKLLKYLGDEEGVAPIYLDRLLFMLRSEEGKKYVRAVPGWQEKLKGPMYYPKYKPIVKLVAILAYFEASCNSDAPRDGPVLAPNDLSQAIFDRAKESLLYILNERESKNRRDGLRIVSLLRPLMRHQVLRGRILTSEVLEKVVQVIDAIVAQRGEGFGQAMDGLICLLQCEDTRNTIIGKLGTTIRSGVSGLSRMLETDNPRLIASLRMVLTLARIPAQEVSEMRILVSAVKSRLEELATRNEGLVGLFAVEILLALNDFGHEFNVSNEMFQANLGRALVHLRSSNDESGHGAAPGLQTLRRHFGLDTENLNDQHKKLIRKLKKTVQKGSARERTVSTMTLLKLCESSTIRKHFSEIHLLDVFIDQLRRKDRALVAAYAVAACLKHDDMKGSIMSNEKLPKNLENMLRLDYFDDAVGTVEGFQIFGELMSHGSLRGKLEEDVITEVLNVKLGKGKAEEVRTSLICLDIFRSLDEEGRWTHKLVEEGLGHLRDTDWGEQKAGVRILSALARTNYGIAVIDPRMVDIVNMLYSPTPPPVSSMMGPACALRILAQNPKLRQTVHKRPQYDELKHLYLSGTLLVGKPDASAWGVKTPNRGDVIDVLDKAIKAIDGELLEEDLIPIDGNVLPHIQHLDRWFRMIGNELVMARGSEEKSQATHVPHLSVEGDMGRKKPPKTGTRAIDLVPAGEDSDEKVEESNLQDASSNEHTGRTTSSPMEDIRSRFPHDLTDYVTRSDDFAFASGGCGDIYRGTFNVKGGTLQVAIKTCKMYLQCDENLDKNIRRFRRETAVWLKLDHPNILPLFGTIRDPRLHPKIPAMVCPWAENGALSAYLERNSNLTLSRRIHLVNDVAQGLRYLHSQNVVHGDLSGSNVLVHADERACICDFGLATLLTHIGGSTFTNSRANNLKGTVRWMAPELFHLNDDNTDAKTTTQSDVYSFGGIMLQILTNQIPYYYFTRDVQVIRAISMGEKPKRPDQAVVTESRWRFMEWCWYPADDAKHRPSGEEIVAFTRKELTEILELEGRAKANSNPIKLSLS